MTRFNLKPYVASIFTACALMMMTLTPEPAVAQKFVKDEVQVSAEESATRKLNNVASINALLVGYGFYCELPTEEVKILHRKYFDLVASVNDETHRQEMTKTYEEQVKVAREKGPSYSSVDCPYIKGEYQKIIAQITSEAQKAPALPKP